MNGFPTTNGWVRSSAIHRTFRHYRIKKLIFINLAFASLNTQSSEKLHFMHHFSLQGALLYHEALLFIFSEGDK